MAATDTALTEDYHALTGACGLVDRSERGRLALNGASAVEFLNGQITNELLDLTPGEGRYAAFLTHKGKMLGDVRVLAVGEPGGPVRELLLDTERVALQALFDMIRRFKVGYAVELHKRTLQTALLSLVGPETGAVVERAFSPQDLPEREHDHLPTGRVRLIATDLGLDVLCDADAKQGVHSALVRAGALSVSEDAAEIVRVERGRPRFGVDVDETTIPQEAGLNERAVSFTKGCYVGQETVARLHYRGKPNRHLRGLLISPTASSAATLPAPGEELRLGDRSVGTLGSVVLSPALGAIGLALVRREAEPRATVGIGESGATAVVVELPFQ